MTEVDQNALPQLVGLTSRHGKDLLSEKRLAILNQVISPIQSVLENDCVMPRTPPVFILGAPRSGTTVLSQLLSSTGQFGIVTNFVARFWQAPALGMMIEEALCLAKDGCSSSMRSVRGVTEGWSEPSEFGYFWSRWFDLGQNSHALGTAERQRFDMAGLRRSVASIEKVVGLPLVFKNNTWFTLNADLLADTFPGCILVVCERDPFYIAQSIWLQRLDVFGDASKWWSVRPADYAEIGKLSPLAQVAAQAVSIVAGMNVSLAQAKTARIVRLPYEEVARDPRNSIRGIVRLALGALAGSNFNQAKLPARLTVTDQTLLSPETTEELKIYIAEQIARYSSSL